MRRNANSILLLIGTGLLLLGSYVIFYATVGVDQRIAHAQSENVAFVEKAISAEDNPHHPEYAPPSPNMKEAVRQRKRFALGMLRDAQDTGRKLRMAAQIQRTVGFTLGLTGLGALLFGALRRRTPDA